MAHRRQGFNMSNDDVDESREYVDLQESNHPILEEVARESDMHEPGGSHHGENFHPAHRRSHTMQEYSNLTKQMISMLPSRNPVSDGNNEDDHTKPKVSMSTLALLTMRRTGQHGEPLESHAQKIVKQMEQDRELMEDNPISEQRRLETLREMPESLTLKRQVRAKLTKSVSTKSKKKPISMWKRMKYRMSMSFTKVNVALKNMLYSMELWYGSLKTIEGHFGSSVATYFRFLRWLFVLNVFVLILSFGFVVMPQILYRMYNVESPSDVPSTASTPDETKETTAGDTLALFTRDLVVREFYNNKSYTVTALPFFSFSSQALTEGIEVDREGLSEDHTFSFGNIFTGKGWLVNTELYYGYYTNETLSYIGSLEYSIQQAYFFTILICYILSLVALSVSMATSYRKNFIESSGGKQNMFSNKIYCGWDFGIATEEAATLKSKSVYNELKELLDDEQDDDVHSSCMTKFYTIVLQIMLNILCILILCGTGALMWQLLDNTFGDHLDATNASMMSLVVTIIMIVVPMLFSWLVKFEDYTNPRTALYVTLTRTFGLEVVVVGVLIAFWLKRSPSEVCWETAIGQEVYRLIVADFIISLIGTSLAEFVRCRIYKSLWKGIGVPEFDIARNTLNIVYNQTLFWVGFYFAPLLALMIVVKIFITFYLKKIGCLYNCQPSSRSWRAAQTQTVFLVLTFLSLLGVLITLGYIISSVEASNCGPFRNYNHVFEMVLKGILKLQEDNDFFKFLIYITKPGVVAFILIAMCVGAYVLRAIGLARKSMVGRLREMLILEAKDKEFLLKSISKITEGEWLYNLGNDKSKIYTERSSTWQYNPSSYNRQEGAGIPRQSRQRNTVFRGRI